MPCLIDTPNKKNLASRLIRTCLLFVFVVVCVCKLCCVHAHVVSMHILSMLYIRMYVHVHTARMLRAVGKVACMHAQNVCTVSFFLASYISSINSNHFQLAQSTCIRWFYPQRPSGPQSGVTGVFPSAPGNLPLLLLRKCLSIPLLVGCHRNLPTRCFSPFPCALRTNDGSCS